MNLFLCSVIVLVAVLWIRSTWTAVEEGLPRPYRDPCIWGAVHPQCWSRTDAGLQWGSP